MVVDGTGLVSRQGYTDDTDRFLSLDYASIFTTMTIRKWETCTTDVTMGI